MLSLLCLDSILVRELRSLKLCNEAEKEKESNRNYFMITMNEMQQNGKNATESISNSRRIFEAEDKIIEITQPEDKEEKIMKKSVKEPV